MESKQPQPQDHEGGRGPLQPDQSPTTTPSSASGIPVLSDSPEALDDEYKYEEGGAISDLDLHLSEGFLTIVRIPLMSEVRQELEAVIQQRGWEWQEGLVNVLATGISELAAQDRKLAPASEAVTRDAGSAAQAKLDPVTQELAYYHAMYSAMKFRAFSLLEKLKVLEMRERALHGKLDLSGKWAEATRAQLENLQAENSRLRQRIEALGGESAETVTLENLEVGPASVVSPSTGQNEQGRKQGEAAANSLLSRLQALLFA